MLHVGQLAQYNYSIVNEKVQLEITLEYSEMKQMQLDNSCDPNTMTALCISNYIIKNSLMKINDQPVNFELMDSFISNNHLIITLHSQNTYKTITSIDIEQATFYEFFEEYRNRVSLNLDKFKGSYMLTKNKNSIKLNE